MIGGLLTGIATSPCVRAALHRGATHVKTLPVRQKRNRTVTNINFCASLAINYRQQKYSRRARTTYFMSMMWLLKGGK